MSWWRSARGALAGLAVSGPVALSAWDLPVVRPAFAQQDRAGAAAAADAGRSCRVLVGAPAAPRPPAERPTRPDVGGGIARELGRMGCAPRDVLLVVGVGLNAAGLAAEFCDFTRQMLVSRAERTAAPPLVTLACVYAGGRREPRATGQNL
jgi:hypothetical protein